MVESNAVQELVSALKEKQVEKNKTFSAVVSHIDQEGVVWVNIAGSNKETPTTSSVAEVKKGDAVTVEWRNNKLYILGNYSNPSAGVARVMDVENSALIARESATNAVRDAEVARHAAGSAQASADEAERIAGEAQVSANSAKTSANTAFTQLSIIENIVGVLQLISNKGTYAPTNDEIVNPDKWYFTRSGESSDYIYTVESSITSVYHLTTDTAIDTGIENKYYTRSGEGTDEDPYVYTIVDTPIASDLNTYYEKYYELTGIDEAIQNYVSSHIIVDDSGLWLQTNGSDIRIQISAEQGNDGLLIHMGDSVVAQYGSSTIIGDRNGFNIRIGTAGSSQEIGFYQGDNKVSYMNGAELYVANSLSFGAFTFVQRENGHFTLKLLR